MITTRKLLILWLVVILAYVLMMIFTNPLLTLPVERQKEVYDVYVAVGEASQGCWPVPQKETAAMLDMTSRNVYVIARYGTLHGWGENPCERRIHDFFN